MRLKDKVAIITGAGQSEAGGAEKNMGNGRASGLTFAGVGAKLMLANRSSPSMDETARLVRAGGFAVESMLADITDEDDCRKLMAATIDAFGRIDVMHNNVGAGTVEDDTADIDLATWQQCLDMNLNGPILLSKHALPRMWRLGAAWDAANGALFLASKAAAYITGAVIPEDDGLTTRVGS
ncbi:MAG: SDR family oxidoreductase [Alphaproteobacteria bacterium]|jgi:NAD(P)-dependent dehydrogenase (short-subunit alcohol dehydrogenase family)|nr:SDR family oxidoreductase [Alphaproteobacteria bacterium]MDP6256548.1 SDR family oxidoreductase [Alphaproteobacteria bacterium]MDP7055529.1 SDR family oxidoreductase [Alphaproteobacteria bacterium]MDP7229393.1 SDR family oxidoreductase [Alphaproteobacteria bacterium]HJM92369.1 SDR family oxidoreductase [Alphaproteobacteria bacterium]|tara:strand:- start:144 stop:686 length:543 start_codon:yes stop_codon:yes gene_type:complete